jgi:dTDP-4-amino-4,6-dideoxygalactose transaminase
LHQKKMSYPFVPANLHVTDNLAKRFILLPCGDFVTCDDIDRIIHLMKFIQAHGAEISRRLATTVPA